MKARWFEFLYSRKKKFISPSSVPVLHFLKVKTKLIFLLLPVVVFLNGVCVCVCVHIHVCGVRDVHVHVCVSMWRPEVSIRCLLRSLLALIFDTGQ